MLKTVRFVNVSLLAGSVSLAAAFAAADTTRSASAHPAPPAAATSPKARTAKPATHTVSGTVESYDATGKTLTVKGSKSTWTFAVGDARVWDGAKSVGLDDLSAHPGAKVTVKYTESGGQKSATSVRLAASHAKSGSKSR